LKDCDELSRAFCDAAGSLGPKLAVLLFQLPPSFKKDLDVLRSFLTTLPPGPRVAFEFRHQSWHDAEVFERLAVRAFPAGWDLLGLPSARLLSLEQCDFASLDEVLSDLDELAPIATRTLLQASAACIESDATVSVNESELLRAVAASLSSPMPPLVVVQTN
jgi:hypothetical protein